MNTRNCGSIWKSLVFATSRARILRLFSFLVSIPHFSLNNAPFCPSHPSYLVFNTTYNHLLNQLSSSVYYLTLFPSLYSSLLYIYSLLPSPLAFPLIVYSYSIHSPIAYHTIVVYIQCIAMCTLMVYV